MMVTKDPGDSASEMFPIEAVIPPVENRETDTSNSERAQHLIEALNYYDSVAEIETTIRKFENPSWLKEQEVRLGKNIAYKWRRQKHEKHQLMLENARSEFMQAYTVDELVASGLREDDAQEELDRRYSIFEQAYRGTSQARREKRNQVRAEYERHVGKEGMQQELSDEQQVVESPIFPPENPNAKVSLARALRPEFARLDPADYAGITRDEILKLHPDFLKSSIVGVPSGTRNARHHLDTKDGKRVYTVFVPGEWDTLLRTAPEFVAETASNKVEKSQRKLSPEARDSWASARAEVHATRGYAERMLMHITQDYDVALETLDRFKEASEYNGGLARFGNEANMREQMDFFWDSLVADMLWATRAAHELPPEWEEQAMRTLVKRVYFADTPAMRLACFGMVRDTAEAWVKSRKDHMLAKSFEAIHYADQKEKELGFRVGQSLPLTS